MAKFTRDVHAFLTAIGKLGGETAAKRMSKKARLERAKKASAAAARKRKQRKRGQS